jgi:hypothetical protein
LLAHYLPELISGIDKVVRLILGRELLADTVDE